MNKQSQWLFETPFFLEASQHANLEYYNNPELESEWELQEASYYISPLNTKVRKSRINFPSPHQRFSPPLLLPPSPGYTRLVTQQLQSKYPLHESSNVQNYYYWQVWWLDPGNQNWVLVKVHPDPFKPVLETPDRAEQIRFQMCRDESWRGGSILCRLWVWSTAQKKWLLSKDFNFGK